MPDTFQTLMPSWRKLSLMGASLTAMSSLIACAPMQYDLAAYENNTQAVSYQAASNRAVNYTAQPAHKRYGFAGHNLDSYSVSRVIHRPEKPAQLQRFASAKSVRLSPYVPPVQTLRPQNIGPQNFGIPTLRPRFEHHLDGPYLGRQILGAHNLQTSAPRAAVQQKVAPQNPIPQVQVQALPQAQILPQALPQTAPITQAFTLQPQAALNAPVVNTFELNNAVNVSPLGLGRFETRPTIRKALSIPELPEPQKQVIRAEQAALTGIEDKSIIAGPASLRRSLDGAFARSSRLAAESLRIDEAEEVLKQAKARSKPRLEFRSAIGPRQSATTFAFSNSTVSATNIRRSAELDLSLPIYQGGRLRAQRSSAELGIETARAALMQTRGQIIQETAIAYLDVVRDRKLTDLYHKNVDLLREQQGSVTELLAVNESTIAEKALVDARLATQRIRLETGLGVLRESEARYKNLVGKTAPQNLPVPSFNLPLSLTEVQALAQQNSPELTALINRAKSAEFDVDVAKSGNKPSLTLQGVLRGAEGQSETIDRNAAAELLLNLRVPISSGGEGRSRVRQAKIVRNRLNLEIRDTQDSLRDQIDRLWARKTASEKSQVFNKTQIDATQFAVNTVAEQRAEGVATVLDLLNVQQTLLDAQIQTVEAESRQDTASVQLLNFMGVYQ